MESSANSLNEFVCEYIGSQNFALNKPTEGSTNTSGYSNSKLDWTVDGKFADSTNQDFNFWHGLKDWAYLQIDLGKTVAVKHSIFQTR